MEILAITDIPRMTALFERLGEQCPGLTVVNDIHRGIEDLDRRRPGLVIFQNRLSGLSADILHKHLRSRLNNRKARFVLISSSDDLEVELSKRFDAILDPALADQELAEVVLHLLDPTRPSRYLVPPETPSPVDREPPVTMTKPDGPSDVAPEPSPPPDTGGDTALNPEPAEQPELPVTYAAPSRSVISDFSQQLEQQAHGGQAAPLPYAPREHEYRIRDLHQEPHLIIDEEPARPWYRTGWLPLSVVTLVLVVIISLVQSRHGSVPDKKTASVPAPSPDAIKDQAPPVAPAERPAGATPLPSHGGGRPKTLPSFVPRDGLDPSYGRQHPGWELYQGAASEHRVFRGKDGAIKAVQVIDRSGAGLQESFYTAMLKELAGTTAMRPTSSEIKEGYEIRRGEAAGLQVVQYRDAQGGRLRGIVITWP